MFWVEDANKDFVNLENGSVIKLDLFNDQLGENGLYVVSFESASGGTIVALYENEDRGACRGYMHMLGLSLAVVMISEPGKPGQRAVVINQGMEGHSE